MDLLLVGLNHQTASVALRERLYLPSDTLQGVMAMLYHHTNSVVELAIISTCNRFEVYASVDDIEGAKRDIISFMSDYFAISEQDLRPSLYTHTDDMLIEHVMKVASGLDSMVLGEAQILGQVSKALDDATQVHVTGAYIHRLFEAALHAGKRARTETEISQHTTSTSHAAALLMRQESAVVDPKVLILGAGEMAELAVLAIHRFALSHIAILNRTHSKAQAIANKFGIVAYEWSRLWEEILDADVVITATGAPHTILEYADLKRVMQQRTQPLMLIDIAVPRDIADDVAKIDGIKLFDIDALQYIVDNSLAARKACIPKVIKIIKEESERYQAWSKQRTVVPVIKELRQGVASVVEDELNQAINKLPDMSEAELEIVKRMAHRIMNKVLHAPTVNLRSRANDDDVDTYTTIVRELFALEINEPDDVVYIGHQ